MGDSNATRDCTDRHVSYAAFAHDLFDRVQQRSLEIAVVIAAHPGPGLDCHLTDGKMRGESDDAGAVGQVDHL